MNILVIDGMGGGIGRAIIERIKGEDVGGDIIAVGTNSIATAAMLKAGASVCATGENAVIFNCERADFIVGVMGIVFANSMNGEISPAMAAAVSKSRSKKILLPMDKCGVSIPGVEQKPMNAYIDEIPKIISDWID